MKKFKINSRVFIPALKVKGVVKEIEENKAKVTYFNKEGERQVEWFEMKKLKSFRKIDEILFAKVRPDAIIPSKREEDGAYDFYANFEEQECVIEPNTVKLIPTGVASAFSSKYRLNLKHERGSTGKIGMAVLCGMVDSGYRGEIFIAINNTNNKTIVISKDVTAVQETDESIIYPYNKAIAQGTLEIVPKVRVREIEYEELVKIPSKRGMGKLGSSNK